MGNTDDTTSNDQSSNQAEQHVSAETPPGRSAASARSPRHRPSALEQAIEAERAQLLQARSVIACLYEVLLHADGDEAVTYAETAYVAGQLIEEAVERLDSARLRPLIAAARHTGGDSPESADDQRFGPHAVREEPLPYLC